MTKCKQAALDLRETMWCFDDRQLTFSSSVVLFYTFLYFFKIFQILIYIHDIRIQCIFVWFISELPHSLEAGHNGISGMFIEVILNGRFVINRIEGEIFVVAGSRSSNSAESVVNVLGSC